MALNNLEKKVLRRAIEELELAYQTVLCDSDKPDFFPITDRRSKGYLAVDNISSARRWLECLLEP